MTTPTVKLLTGDAYKILDELSPKSVDCIWASPNPPLMFQGPDMLVGTEDTIGDYIDHLCAIFNKCLRVIKDTGSLWIRIGDYHNQVGFLNCAPARLQYQLAELGNGWVPMGQISWLRQDEDYPENGLKYEPPKKRFLRNVEYMQWYTKQPRGYYFDPQDGLNLSSMWRYNYNYDDTPSHIPHEIIELPLTFTCPHNGNGVVLDPFHGRGNTMIVALKYGLHYVGIEILPNRVEESLKKLKALGLEHRMITTA